MQSNIIRFLMPAFVVLLIAALACNLPGGKATSVPPTQAATSMVRVAEPFATATVAPPTPTAAVVHTMTPTGPKGGKLVYDVESAGTASEKRAPYGDAYEWNRLERPFTPDMSYMSDLDIDHFTVAKDSDWWYVSLKLIGIDPNNALLI